jgi:Secretion system C-terminal sorting domain
MKRLFLFISLFLFTGICFVCKAQYTGGNADGFSSNVLITSVCSSPANSNIYFGGSSDGYASNTFIKSVCAPVAGSNIYFGGNADGFSSNSFTASVCPPRPNSNIFYGGNADGFSSNNLTITVCPVPANTNIYYGGNADGYSSFIVYGPLGPCMPLPIKLVSFTGECSNQQKVLKWSTAIETNNKYFTIEYSADGTSWLVAGTITGAGNSETIRDYSFIDTKMLSGISYYRLKQTDFDGKFVFSYIIFVENCIDHAAVDLTIYPNPSGGIFSLLFNGNKSMVSSIEITNIAGEKLYSFGNYRPIIDLSDKPAGIYFVQLVSNGKDFIKKIIILK